MSPASLIPEVICLLCAVIFLSGSMTRPWNSFIYYLALIVAVEVAGYFMGLYKINNHWLYNAELIVEYFYLLFVFKRLLIARFTTKIMLNLGTLIFLMVFILESHYNFYYGAPGDNLNKISRLLASVILFLCAGWYFYELLDQSGYIVLKKHPGFWLVVGIFLFYFVTAVSVIFFSALIRIHINGGLYVSHVIFSSLNIILYGCWSYAFICRKKQTI